MSCDYIHKGNKTFINCLYCFPYISSHLSLMSFYSVKTKESFKYIWLIVKSTYRLASIWCTYDYNSRRFTFFHSIALKIDEGGKVIYSFRFRKRHNYIAYLWKMNITQNSSPYFSYHINWFPLLIFFVTF